MNIVAASYNSVSDISILIMPHMKSPLGHSSLFACRAHSFPFLGSPGAGGRLVTGPSPRGSPCRLPDRNERVGSKLWWRSCSIFF